MRWLPFLLGGGRVLWFGLVGLCAAVGVVRFVCSLLGRWGLSFLPSGWAACRWRLGVIRKAIKKRKIFPSDDSARKMVYLAIKDASKKWSMPIQNWRQAMSRFIIEFEERLEKHIN